VNGMASRLRAKETRRVVATKAERKDAAQAEMIERRREPRARVNFPIEISGFDSHKRLFTERTFTLEVTSSGCRFSVSAPVENHSAIAIRVLLHRGGVETDLRPMLFEVVGVEPGEFGYTLAAVKLQQGPVWPSSPFATDESQDEDKTLP
jgi:hypothetical protein